jgi:hypothetical protein
MNTSQLLQVATKVFINRDQEAKWEADRKMKRKVDLLVAVLDGQSGGRGELIQVEAEAIPKGNSKCFQDTPTLGRNWGKTNVPTVGRKGIGRMSVPSEPETPKKPSRLKAEVWVVEGRYQPTRRGARLWEESTVGLAGLESYEED